MTGISEVLVLILLICGILILPRMLKPAPKQTASALKTQQGLSTMKLRAGIVFSLLYIIVLTLFIKPWQGQIVLFVSAGILPVALAWSLVWIFSAKKK